MTLTFIIVIALLGVILMLLELFVLPGVLVGIIGLVLSVYAIFHAYADHSMTIGHYVLGGTILASALGFFAFFKSGAFDKLAQKGVIDSKMNEIDPSKYKPGDRGVTISALRPTGNAMFGEDRIEVNSQGGEIIESRTEIEIISIRDNKIIVKKA